MNGLLLLIVRTALLSPHSPRLRDERKKVKYTQWLQSEDGATAEAIYLSFTRAVSAGGAGLAEVFAFKQKLH